MKLVKKVKPKLLFKKNKIKKGDTVKIIAGKHKGIISVVTKVLLPENRLLIEGIMVKKHQKATENNQESGIIDVPAALHASNVMLIDPKSGKNKTTTRIGFSLKNDKKIRISKKTGAPID